MPLAQLALCESVAQALSVALNSTKYPPSK
jgi:hypothetical protein